MNRHVLSTALAASATLLLLAGCSSSATAGSTAPTGIAVVASTNVYGDLAAAIGGDLVSVTSIIDDPNKDPHDFQADAQNQLALSKAQLVIENGGGYDDFVDTMLSAADNGSATVLNVADLSGYDQNPATGSFNEHLWYDFPTVSKLVDALVSTFSAADPGGASTFQANGDAAKQKLGELSAREADLASRHSGAGAAITEPVPLYLLTASGLVDETPEAFSAAVEGGTDAPALVLQQTLGLFASHSVVLLGYNSQTGGPQSDAVVAAAQSAGVPAVPFTETLPAGLDYFSWMTQNVDAVAAALGE
ncbi:zinc ABC transporter substrate-binding protein [Herbiconiux sp. 11R-BC]|uniref:metal ABC transporter solute-binding protein, Zn/Mn family n=1 Tax=Herbiconiux sp. 11R-BC TaxID=3111637 RepID=UPI003C03EB51